MEAGGLIPQTSEWVAAQYDIVFGTYYETLYDGAMYYWQAADDEAFTIHEDWVTDGTTLDKIKVHGNHAEVVGSKDIEAVGTGAFAISPPTRLGSSIQLRSWEQVCSLMQLPTRLSP